ncbi:MAG: polysaccharide deacetylase [Lachnospiraceae bacterium]|nr:polysaccharide deacetylase [Lachnospiraceae bacterium]
MAKYENLNRRNTGSRRNRRRRRPSTLMVILCALIVGLLIAGVLIYIFVIKPEKTPSKVPEVSTTEEPGETEIEGDNTPDESADPEEEVPGSYSGTSQEAYEEAQLMAAMYDYNGAVEFIKSAVPGYAGDAQILKFITECETKAGELVKWPDNTQITHIFFHTLILDNKVAFSSANKVEYNQVMTTLSEFKEIMQEMYDRGYVLVRLSDIASIDPGTGQMTYNPIYLPEGKTPFVLSEDDVCYYEYMNETGGYANRLVVTPEGRIMNEVDQPDGSVVTGAFDVLPILDDFILEHPDFSYHGAKGIIALTGYNGILGYRTSYIAYGSDEILQQHYQELFCAGGYDEAHAYELARGPKVHLYDVPDIEEQRAKAKEVADAILADGWDFASHTWGHMPMDQVLDQMTGTVGSERFFRDTVWFDVEVQPLIGHTNILIYPKGADIHTWRNYTDENQAYVFLKSMGFDYYCNVDSAKVWVQMDKTAGGSGYLRTGRRNLDGTMFMKAMLYPEKELLTDIVDVWKVWDKERPVPVANVTVPEGVTGLTFPDGTYIPFETN